MRRSMAMTTVARAVALLLLAALLLVLGGAALALMAVSPVFGVGALSIGAGLRLVHEFVHGPSRQ